MDDNSSYLRPTSSSDNHTTLNTGGVPDNQYYFELVVFKVGNTIFRVPKNGFLVPETIFEAMFSLPTAGDNIQGLNDQNPIDLPVNEEDFRGFLRAMYPFNGLLLKSTDWLGALAVSTIWMFDEIRNRAIQALEPWIANQTAKEVVLLARKYHVLKWLKGGYTRLLQQSSLTATELSATPSLDWETIARLLSAKLGISSRSLNFSFTMEQEFKEEFSNMGDGCVDNNNPATQSFSLNFG